MNKKETGLVRGNNAFALQLHRELAEQGGNVFVSPYIVSAVMAIAHLGARGMTQEEIREALHFPTKADAITAEFSVLSDAVRGDAVKEGYELSSAVGLWAQHDYQFTPDFLDQCQRHFKGGLNRVDFRNDPDQIQQAVNAWVSEHTSDAIEELTIPDIKNPLNRLLVCSAVYFKGTWLAPFKKEQTKTAEFRVSKEKTVQVPMMHQKEEFKYADAGDVRLLELRYIGTDWFFEGGIPNEVSMIILLPEADDGLPELEKSLSPKLLDAYLGKISPTRVDVYLPRFKIELEADIAKNLQNMGVETAFDRNRADFSGIDGRKHWMYLGPVIHKARVDVDEVGTVAAAAVAGLFQTLGIVGPGVFKADHPFLFLIRHNRTGSILFVGRVTDPSE